MRQNQTAQDQDDEQRLGPCHESHLDEGTPDDNRKRPGQGYLRQTRQVPAHEQTRQKSRHSEKQAVEPWGNHKRVRRKDRPHSG